MGYIRRLQVISYPPAGEGTSECFFTYSSASQNLAEKAKIVKEKVFLEKTSLGKEIVQAYKVHSPIRGTCVADLLPKLIVYEAECETGILLVSAPNKGAVPSWRLARILPNELHGSMSVAVGEPRGN